MSSFNQETPRYITPAPQTSYLRAKQMWDDRFAAFAHGADQWRKIAIICMILTVLLLTALVLSLSWHKPSLYIAEISKEGQIANVKLLPQAYQPNEAQQKYFIVHFIKLLREIPLDPVAAKNNWLNAYNFLSNRGAKVLNDYFQKNNPLPALNKKTVTVEITHINPLSKNSFQIDWKEESVSQAGQIINEQAMSGIFTVDVHAPKDEQAILKNPLGIFITDFHIATRM